jgi:hypothetical protein
MSTAPAPVEAEFTLLRKQYQGVRLRKSVRYRCHLATLCYVTFPGETERHEAWAANLSNTGIGFYLNRRLEPETILVLRLKRSSGTALTMQSRVIHSTEQSDGTFCIGCEFAQPLDLETLDELL